MNELMNVLAAYARAFAVMWAQPYVYIALLLVVVQYRRAIFMERKLFAVRLHRLGSAVWRTLLWGAAAGAAGTAAMAFIGGAMHPGVIVWLWSLALVLALFRIRFLCLAYASGVLVLLNSMLALLPGIGFGGAEPLVQPLRELHAPSLLALVAVLHLMEALLVRVQGAELATPLFLEGKRGKLVGGYQLVGLWPAPLFLLVPAADPASSLPWMPLLGGELWAGGWTVAAFPVVLGFTDVTRSMLPGAKARVMSARIFGYGLLVLLFAAGSEAVPWLAFAAAAAVIVAHEAIIAVSRSKELASPPIYTHGANGLTVLAVVPGSPAHEMGIVTGETIHKVNGVKVRTKEELHAALRQNNAAFTKLEVLNLEGHSKFASRAIFAGEHHQLGIILAPDDRSRYYMTTEQPSLVQALWSKLSGLARVDGKGSSPEGGKDIQA